MFILSKQFKSLEIPESHKNVKKVFFKCQSVKIASMFEAKNVHLGAKLSNLSQSSTF